MNDMEVINTYAKLANLAYLDLSKWSIPEGRSIDDKETIIDVSISRRQEVLPEALVRQLIASRDQSEDWSILTPYYKTDPITRHSDPDTGFAGMLLGHEQHGKVLVIAGTEFRKHRQTYYDLLKSSLSQIGLRGVAVEQLVSLFNYVQVLKASPGQQNVLQLNFKDSWSKDDVPEGRKSLDFSIRIGKHITFARHFWLEASYDGVGQGGLDPTDTLTVTGHSLGGHLAALATALMPDLFTAAYTFNAPGFNPPTANTEDFGADRILSLFEDFTAYGANPLPVSSIADKVHTVESESAAPGSDMCNFGQRSGLERVAVS